jgi:hypothetical protein
MRRTLIALALALATANPTAAQSAVAQPKPKCPIARGTLLGAAVGFGAGAIIAFPVPGVGQNVFEDTGNTSAPWATLIGLTIVGAVIGNVLARRNCATTSPSITQSTQSLNVLLSETDVQRLAQTVRLKTIARETQWMRASASTAARLADPRIPAVFDEPESFPSSFGWQQ